MSTREKIVLSTDTVEGFLQENFYNSNFESTMPADERLRLASEATTLWVDEEERAEELYSRVPIDPAVALRFLVNPGLGRDFIRDGWNLSDVEKAFGKDWLDRFEVENEKTTNSLT